MKTARVTKIGDRGMKMIFNGHAAVIKNELQASGLSNALSIGRRAPLHVMHLDCLLDIAAAGFKPVIIIGSSNEATSPLYDPLKNPLTVSQQKEQLLKALPKALYTQSVIDVLPDDMSDQKWLDDLMALLARHQIGNKAVMHFRAKAVDAKARQKPLSAYREALLARGVGIWQSFNERAEDDEISATAMRLYDLERLTEAQKKQIVAFDYIQELALAARARNPDQYVLQQHRIPVTMLDLTLSRLREEAEISTDVILNRIRNKGEEINLKTLLATTAEYIAWMQDENKRINCEQKKGETCQKKP